MKEDKRRAEEEHEETFEFGSLHERMLRRGRNRNRVNQGGGRKGVLERKQGGEENRRYVERREAC